ncbi:DUF6752 domain-containing protein [Leucobacter soli]|uniref:DUF6752 domain-containing protein n=1 Tax=Leucobacter soli TaxID=2812850 RepID=A0A916JYX9_9MICO|nr:DUF6752 domain-containing protein [Leucobacter soli]CAG7617111.1 hypothetical protein LEUCIP111803_02064 [Leucobacter soli]
MKQRFKRFARSVRDALPGGPRGSLRARVERLERELDECRRDSRRAAELLDLVEERLTPRSEADRA